FTQSLSTSPEKSGGGYSRLTAAAAAVVSGSGGAYGQLRLHLPAAAAYIQLQWRQRSANYDCIYVT
ncbi:unnamed protein product, partial [Urochloa humidicola]